MQQLISVGIDIGTSTTQVIYSRLSVDDTSYASQLSQMEIVDKEILYKGRIYMTPIVRQRFLAMDALKTILDREFEASGIRREEVASGAVIITGEAANKENAASIAEALAEYAGNLVVAIAGPDLEGILAGIGSGAQQKAREQLIRLVNFDIGGGTANAAVFDKGRLADAYALHIGGRLIQFDAAHRVTYCSPFVHKMLQEENADSSEVTAQQAESICREFADILVRIAEGRCPRAEEKALMIYHPPQPVPVDACSFSGGVGEFVYQEDAPADNALFYRYGDIGPRLGLSIRQRFAEAGIPIVKVPERIRATVIGAGVHSMKLSGSTVFYDAELLPLKNVPVVAIPYRQGGSEEAFLTRVRQKAARNAGDADICLSIPDLKKPRYQEIKSLAKALCQWEKESGRRLLLVLPCDCAKVLGQTLAICRDDAQGFLCVDNVRATDGMYIDFCKPVGGSVLLVIKTLIFKN
ncbi:ethanolamine ammonia-lyase reactivating factor EutA [Mitsuokella sp.]|uniref:ethanolamine ammonia-lyase reactivating factor EutA n=1 Tax=Mitsuokella sp. TaxID=2049034 RepID=UPI002A7EC368|nr:ethanolamine ammonia-lyase reactivating factor EutA [Mitsuokella sp.]MDY4473883.1 ethanolamine ammonia-lyase reactivating factor EutA [Mitsuokella sp.]